MQIAVVSIPMRERFRGLTVREAVLVQDDGAQGWAEFSPFADYSDAVAANWWQAAHEALTVGWPAPVRDSVPVNVTIPAIGPEAAGRLVREAGCSTAKVKVAEAGQGEGDDIERLQAVRDALGSTGAIRIDVNGGWDVDTAVDRIARYDRAAGGLQYVEQPCATVDELAIVRRKVNVLIAADESIRLASDPMLVKEREAADIVMLKVQPLGGVWNCLRLAEQIELPVVVSSAIETSVGIAAGLALAAALPELPYACGLATVGLFEADIVDDPLLPIDGVIAVRRPQPTLERLTALAAPADRDEWWRARLDRVRSLAGAR